MGFAISWCAVRQEQAARMLAEMNLVANGKKTPVQESEIAMRPLASGWCLVWFEDHGARPLTSGRLAEFSKTRDILVCRVEEHVMESIAEYWSQGRQTWKIRHIGEDGPIGIEVEGSPPDSLIRVRKEMEREQLEAGGENADVDHLFEIPLLVAKDLVGFKHDESDEEVNTQEYEELEEGKAPGFLAKLFGKSRTRD